MNKVLQLLDRARSLGRSGAFRARRLRQREKYRADYSTLAECVLNVLEFETVLDVGCANGFLLREFQRVGKDVRGIDLSPDLSEVVQGPLLQYVETGDFSEARGEYDLVCCIEVAEHIPEPRSEELVDTLVQRATSHVLFSAAPPGQLGCGHINCRPMSDWLEFFRARGWHLDQTKTEAVRGGITDLERATWLQRNCVVLSN